jgi:NADPH2 dehydrogenase
MSDYTRIATLRSVAAFRDYLETLGIDLPCDDALQSAPKSPLAQPLAVLGRTVGNRFAIQPMEGWDGAPDGRPTERTVRRWRHFGESGAKLIWGGEAVAVRHDGRANPNQLMLTESTLDDLARLRETLAAAHRAAMGGDLDLLIGLQLTHSGRFARPNGAKLEPVILYRHPLLDRKFGIPPDYPLMTDGEIRRLIADFVLAAKRAQGCGFDFVDIKHCHGYLGHEFLSAVTREGDYGGSLENRTRFLREIAAGIRAEAPGLGIGVRLSAFDFVPFKPDPDQSAPGKPGPGIAETYCDCMPYVHAFGVNPDQPTDLNLTEPIAFFEILRSLDIRFVNITAGSPYYNPHIQRPALYPPSDGYLPPEDPLIGVARQMFVTRYLKQLFPDFTLVGTAYTYLQEFLPNVAQAAAREGWTDFVGLGRMVLAYPELPRDILRGGPIQTKRMCRTFSDCTTAPRNGLVSGCYPLDPYYKKSREAAQLAAAKKAAKA